MNRVNIKFYFLSLKVVCITVVLVSTVVLEASEIPFWKDLTNGLKERSIKALAINPNKSQLIFIGTPRAVYKSEDRGNNWKRVLAISEVNSIIVDPKNTSVVYVATSRGIFKSSDDGKNWRRVFTASDDEQRYALNIAIHPKNSNEIYVGTKAGLFTSKDAGEKWEVVTGIERVAIYKIAINEASDNQIFLATSKGIYKSSDSTGNFDLVFAMTEEEVEDDDNGETEFESSDSDNGRDFVRQVSDIEFDPANKDIIFAATNKGIFRSSDSGGTWQVFEANGLINNQINYILVSPRLSGLLYVATDGGVFRFYKGQWQCLYKGLISQVINILAFEPNFKVLWAGTNNGIFRLVDNIKEEEKASSDSGSEINSQELLNKFDDEPTIKQVQEVAVRYAEVNQDKILSWRKKAQMKALLPSLSVGVDHDKGKESYLTRGNYWYSGTYRGIDDTNHWGSDKNFGWDVTLSWDLGDLVWNDDQTSIDVRSRLMVQLRDDILNEVIRLYFERRRIQAEILVIQPADLRVKIEKELRIQELTAGIDALTGGYFSRAIEDQKSSKN